MYEFADASAAAELCAVEAGYGAVRALRAVDLTIERGRITVLLGPNGAGKTTALALLLGLRAPDAGIARVFGRDPRSPAARRRVGALMQVAKVPDTLRVCEHIDTFRSYYPRPLSRAALVRTAGLDGLERRLYGTLSGGERQRVLLALALAGDPDLLFLDEPTVGMDAHARRRFWLAIRALRADGRAVLLTTHHLEEADALADRVVVLHHGRIIADGDPAAIRQHTARRRIRCTTALSLATVRAMAGVESATADGNVTELVVASAEQAARALLAADASLHGLEITSAGLEEAFLELTREPAAAMPA